MNLTPSAGNNYACIDEVWNNPNDDTDYVYGTDVSNLTDVYNCPNPSLSGTINYVRIIGRAKSDTIAQAAAGNYKLSCYDGSSTGYSDNNAPLPTSYSKYYGTWATKPSGGAWSWTDINNLRIGIQCSSPAVADASTLTLRPNGVGNQNQGWTAAGDTNQWECVDEESSDSDTTYVNSTNYSSTCRTQFALPSHTTEVGVIEKVTVYAIAKRSTATNLHINIRTHSTDYESSGDSLTTSYASYNNEWSTNPNTSAAWTWAEIDAVELGVRVGTYTPNARVTQVYAIITYNKTPEIRTTQCYAIVNYTPSASVVTLPDPKNIDLSHSRNIQRKNLPSGNYIVYDAGRGSKTLTIVGTETSAAYTDMDSLKTICHYGAKVTIAGLDDTNLNTDYWVSDIGFSAGPGYPANMYDYKLTLEEL